MCAAHFVRSVRYLVTTEVVLGCQSASQFNLQEDVLDAADEDAVESILFAHHQTHNYKLDKTHFSNQINSAYSQRYAYFGARARARVPLIVVSQNRNRVW